MLVIVLMSPVVESGGNEVAELFKYVEASTISFVRSRS